ncbi:PTS fructose transporter subunit IIA [Alkalibaculum sp. M08DMB]|uniref:PTS fructose transporter subunit IIA n=1 Tax=Alkalibaculum sporogenes TaxID=2655001 RepID=A0A6A7K857_9FIRM|nr:fructose PTS transporter subunit IIA [Alkalibaculum sporogenes]MPW25668.1 PTS fructose transporter subunit IIA [Alkalibaculum sporogenes]
MNNIINKNLIKLDVQANSKEDAMKELISLMEAEGRLNDVSCYTEEVLAREALCTTGIGFGIAIPHGKCGAVKNPTVAFGRITTGIEWKSLDGDPVNMIFLLAVPKESESNEHLKILAALSRKLMNEDFRNDLLSIQDESALLTLLETIF